MTRGTADDLCWVVETIERTTIPQYKHYYPWKITGRIADVGVDRGPFTWRVPDLDEAAYVPAPGVEIPADARTPNPYTPPEATVSYLSVLAVVPDRRPSGLAEFRNAHGWHPSIWDRILLHKNGTSAGWFNDDQLRRLWRRIETLPEWVQVPLVLTFDVGVIPMSAFGHAADLLDEFERRLPAPAGHVNHVPAMAELLRSGPETPLLGTCGSTGGNPFVVRSDDEDAEPTGIPLEAMYVLPQHRETVAHMFAGRRP